MMTNSPKIMSYFMKKEQVEERTRDMKVTKEIANKHEMNTEDKISPETKAENEE